jgi:hypothetical protein
MTAAIAEAKTGRWMKNLTKRRPPSPATALTLP